MEFLKLNNASNIQRTVPAEPKNAMQRAARKSADEFEAIFISQILKSMSAGVKTDGAFGGGNGEDIFKDVLSEEMGKTIAKNGGIGLSDAVYRELLRAQEA